MFPPILMLIGPIWEKSYVTSRETVMHDEGLLGGGSVFPSLVPQNWLVPLKPLGMCLYIPCVLCVT